MNQYRRFPYFRVGRAFLLGIFLFGCAAAAAAGEPGSGVPPQVRTSAAILIDLTTDTVLFEKNPQAAIPPASLTKLMSIHLALERVDAGEAALDDVIPVSAAADFRNAPPRSSLMFLEEGQRVTLLELLRGLALPSGNDAAMALAESLTGGLDSFITMMNEEARRLGMENTVFADASGYSENNRTTVRDWARFCRVYLERHPYALEELHLLTAFTYPKKRNLGPEGSSVYGPITQPNHNNLIGVLEGCDGLKTGYIDESGYNLAVTAEREGRRLLAVLLGGPGRNSREGSLIRAVDAAHLLDYGFYAYTVVSPPPGKDSVRVYGGARLRTPLAEPSWALLSLPARDAAGLQTRFIPGGPLTAPVEAGAAAGTWEVRQADGTLLLSEPAVTAEAVPAGNWLQRLGGWVEFRRDQR